MFEEIPESCRYGYVRVSSKSQVPRISKRRINQTRSSRRVEVGSALDSIQT